jgi:hypothetical protein
MALGMSPDQHSPRHLHDATDVLQLRPEHRLQQVMPALQDLLADDSRSGRHLAGARRHRRRGPVAGGQQRGAAAGGPAGVLRGGGLVRGAASAPTPSAKRMVTGQAGAAVLGRAPGPHPPRLGLHCGAHQGPGHRPAARRAGRLRTFGHHQRGHAADGAVRGPGGGIAAGNVRRRRLPGCLVFRACVPAGCPPAWLLRSSGWSYSGTSLPPYSPTASRAAADAAPGGDPGTAGFTRRRGGARRSWPKNSTGMRARRQAIRDEMFRVRSMLGDVPCSRTRTGWSAGLAGHARIRGGCCVCCTEGT